MQWLHLNVLLLELLKIFKVLQCTNTFTMECKECLKSKELGRREGQERQKKSKTVADIFGSTICVLVFQFQGVPLYICLPALYGRKKKEGLGFRKNKENERLWRTIGDRKGSVDERRKREPWEKQSIRVRGVRNKEYCAVTSSLHPLKWFLCLPNPNSGGVLTAECLAFPSAHVNTEWWWLRKWLYGNYITEWWGVKWWFFSYIEADYSWE